MKKAIILSVLCLLFTGIAQAKPTLFLSRADHSGMQAWVDSVYASMTAEERIGQLIAQVVNPRNASAARQEIKLLVTKYHIGCIYFSKGEAETHAALANYANSLSNVPVMVGLDGEWGLSMRMPDTPRFPKNMALGAIKDDRLLYEYGLEVARECRLVGVNANFAPAVDVNSNPKNPVIGTRSYGENPLNVARKAVAYARGLEDGGVLSVAKHFPGHGDTDADSHKTLPVVNRPLADIHTTDLVPFKSYINAGLSGIMVAHLNIPSLTLGTTPTSLSERVVAKLLKNELGFEGLVFTDALEMNGARVEGMPNGLAAFLAGADVLLEPHGLESNFKALKDYYDKGGKNAGRIEKACKKILSYKYAMGLNAKRPVQEQGLVARINSRSAELVNRKLYAAAMTVLKNDNNLLPLKNLDSRICVVSLGAPAKNAFSETCALYTKTETYAMTEQNADAVIGKLNGAAKIIVGIFDRNLSTTMNLDRLVLDMGAGNVVPVFFTKAYDVAAFSGAVNLCNTAIFAYEEQPLAQEYAAQVVFGGSDATGRLPVTVEGVARCGDGIDLHASRLGYGMPEEVGLDARLIAEIDSFAREGIRTGAFPGCEVLVARHNKIVVNKSYGYIDNKKTEKVDGNTLYDLASVSKATGTLAGIMKAIDEGKMGLDKKLSAYIKTLSGTPKGDFTIRHLLYHETGMPASLNMYKEMTDTASFSGSLVKNKKSVGYNRYAGGAYINASAKVRSDITSPVKTETFNRRIGRNLYVGQPTYDTIMGIIHNIPLRDNRNFRYSCLNFCLLMEAEQNATGMPHDRYVADRIFRRLGAYHSVYRPLEIFKKQEIASTELDEYFRQEIAHGIVHDETAAFSGGVQGNAGFFSNANDLAKLCQMWLNGGMYGGEQFLSNRTVHEFITSKSPNSHRGLGFDKPNTEHPDRSSTCAEAGAEVFGHTGFTGTGFWVDPKNDLIYIFLCNRVHPLRNNSAFTRLGARAGMFAAVYHSIERAGK